MILNIFLSLLTFFVLSASIEANAQQSCSSLFARSPLKKLTLAEIHTSRDLIKYFSSRKVIKAIRDRNPLTDHNPELEVSIRGAMAVTIEKLQQVVLMPELQGHQGLRYISFKILEQVTFIKKLIKEEKLSYINYLYNSYSLIASVNALMFLENSVREPNLEMYYFARDDHTVDEQLFQANRDLKNLDSEYVNRFIAQDLSAKNLKEIAEDLNTFRFVPSSPKELWDEFLKNRDILPLITFKTVERSDFIDLDMKDLYLIEISGEKHNPHGGWWYALAHANHDVFHLKQILKSNNELTKLGLWDAWKKVRRDLKAYMKTIKDPKQREILKDQLYDLVHENPDLRARAARIYKYSQESDRRENFLILNKRLQAIADALKSIYGETP